MDHVQVIVWMHHLQVGIKCPAWPWTYSKYWHVSTFWKRVYIKECIIKECLNFCQKTDSKGHILEGFDLNKYTCNSSKGCVL